MALVGSPSDRQPLAATVAAQLTKGECKGTRRNMRLNTAREGNQKLRSLKNIFGNISLPYIVVLLQLVVVIIFRKYF
jgi:hypothetical protein